MAEVNEADREVYPLSTQQGIPIPLDVGEPIALAKVAFTDSPTAKLPLPNNAEVLMVRSDQDAIVRFGQAAQAMSDSTFYAWMADIPADTIVFLAVPVNRKSISVVRGGSSNGTLVVQVLRTWRAVKQTAKAY